MRVALFFPGQGSQSVGMHLAASGSVLDADTLGEADEALGAPLSRWIAEGPEERLSRTEVTQPAILTVSIAALRYLRARTEPFEVVAAAGHSLGEYAALVAAGALDLADALRLVRLRGRAMQEAVPLGVGTMAAIVGLDEAAVIALCARHAEGEVVSVAALNCPGQVSIAGHVGAVGRVAEATHAAGGAAKLLAVSAPFHCAMLAPAAERLREALATVSLRAPLFPVFHNVDALPAPSVDAIRERLVAQVVAPVRWADCARAVRDAGPDVAFECGPGRTLLGLQRRIDRSLPVRLASEA
jgi:[acyl-carrier-protein] S-malonyltransferase